MFRDRGDAGDRLALALEKYRSEKPLVLAIPRGGVEIGIRVARHLESDFSLLIARKLPFPDNPEAGFGAIAEDGSTFVFEKAEYWLPGEAIERIRREQLAEIERRIRVLRKGKPLPEIAGRTVILVDDGIAMGSTMRAAIRLCKNRKAGKIVVAVPVTGRRVTEEIGRMVDAIVVLEIPVNFRAVAQVYQNWYDVSDEEVLDLLGNKRQE